MTNKEPDLLATSIGFIAATIFVLVSILLYSFTLSKMWLWFLVPTLKLPPIGMAQAYGIMLIIGLITHLPDMREQAEKTIAIPKVLNYLFARPLLFLLFGWATSHFLVG